MTELLKLITNPQVLKLLANPVVITVLIITILSVLVTFVVFSLSKILTITDRLHKNNQNKIQTLQDYAKNIDLPANLREEAQILMEALIFKNIYEIYVENREYRSALIEFKNTLSYKINWNTIKKAKKFLVFKDSQIIMRKLKWHEQIIKYYLIISFFILLTAFAVSTIAIIFENFSNILDISFTIVIYIILILIADLYRPFLNQTKIEKELSKLKEKTI